MKRYRLRTTGGRYIGGMPFNGHYGKVGSPIRAISFATRSEADAAAIKHNGSWVEEYEAEPATMKGNA